MNIVIYFIDDKLKDIEDIVAKLNAFAQNNEYPNNEYNFQFKSIEGTIAKTCFGYERKFYELGVIETIRNKLAEEQGEGNIMGLLLDALLTEEDMIYSRSKYYPKASIARDIYSEFSEIMPIYIITDILNFGTQSDIIMGVELRDSFMLKACLDYPGDVYVKNMFNKYIEMIKKQSR